MDAASLYTSGHYQSLVPDWHEADLPWKAGHILNILRKNGVAPATVVDVGCGVGAIVRQLSDHFPDARFAGYDVAPLAIERAKRSGANGRLHFEVGDPFRRNEVHDLALAIDVFEHVEDYIGFLRNMRHISRLQVYHIPLDLSVQGVLRGKALTATRAQIGHLHYFSKETALATLADTGHTVIDWTYTAGAIETTSDRRLRKRVAALPRRAGFALFPDLAVRCLGGFSILALCS